MKYTVECEMPLLQRGMQCACAKHLDEGAVDAKLMQDYLLRAKRTPDNNVSPVTIDADDILATF